MSVSTVQSYMQTKYGGNINDWNITLLQYIHNTAYYSALNNVTGYHIQAHEDIHGKVFVTDIQMDTSVCSSIAHRMMSSHYTTHRCFPDHALLACPDIVKYYTFFFDKTDREVEYQNACQSQNTQYIVTGDDLWIRPMGAFYDKIDLGSSAMLKPFLPDYLSEDMESFYGIEKSIFETKAVNVANAKNLQTYDSFIKDMESRGFIYDVKNCPLGELYPYI